MGELDAQQIVSKQAAALGLLDSSGKLTQLSSLTIVDLVLAIEEACGIEIPIQDLQAFNSIESLAAVVAQCAGAAKDDPSSSG